MHEETDSVLNNTSLFPQNNFGHMATLSLAIYQYTVCTLAKHGGWLLGSCYAWVYTLATCNKIPSISVEFNLMHLMLLDMDFTEFQTFKVNYFSRNPRRMLFVALDVLPPI